MRQWLRGALVGAIFVGAIAPADARGLPRAAAIHAVGSRGSARPAVAARPDGAQAPRRAFRNSRHGWAFASGIGYGLPWGDGSNEPDEAARAPLPLDYPPPPWLYGYGPPHQACFKPRLITVGKASPKTHLPRVVYGGPLPCSWKV